jgi:hypothetical protein
LNFFYISHNNKNDLSIYYSYVLYIPQISALKGRRGESSANERDKKDVEENNYYTP